MFKENSAFEPFKAANTRDAADAARASWLVCVDCGRRITTEQARIEMLGRHSHTFTNPHEITYRIGCFRDAAGCSHAGASTYEFTWFPGYAWRLALCTACGAHLGWLYRKSDGSCFHGLILNRLRSEEQD